MPGPDVEQRGARRVGGVGRVQVAAGEMPQQKCIDRTEGELPGNRRLARAADVVEQPGDFVAEKYGSSSSPVHSLSSFS